MNEIDTDTLNKALTVMSKMRQGDIYKRPSDNNYYLVKQIYLGEHGFEIFGIVGYKGEYKIVADSCTLKYNDYYFNNDHIRNYFEEYFNTPSELTAVASLEKIENIGEYIGIINMLDTANITLGLYDLENIDVEELKPILENMEVLNRLLFTETKKFRSSVEKAYVQQN